MSESRPKVPEPGPDLILDEQHITAWNGPLWRIHWATGHHPSAWDELRTYGPIDSMRWDPQGEDGVAPAHGFQPSVAYTATTVYAAFAEVFQDDRGIHLHSSRNLSAWHPTRELRLIDLAASDFGVHNHAAHLLPSENKALTRSWARAIFDQLGDRIDGLLHESTIIGDRVAVLFTGARDAYPTAPSFSRPLDHVDVAGLAADVAGRLRWPIL